MIITDRIESVTSDITITLKDGQKITLQIVNSPIEGINNFVKTINITESLSAINSNPVGVVSSNILRLDIRSLDRALIPENKNSPYYGLMDNSATINIKTTDVDGEVDFGTFYVSNWKSSVTYNTPNRVTIEATDLMSLIGKATAPDMEINKDINTSSYLAMLIDKLNQSNQLGKQVLYNLADIGFPQFPNLVYANIEFNNVSGVLNTLSQSTLTNIFIDRDGYLKTDYCLDDSIVESVGDLSDKVNIVTASVDNGGLVGYNKVRTNYMVYNINAISKVAQLTGQTLIPGDNDFSNIRLINGAFKVNYAKVGTKNPVRPLLKDLSYSKSRASLVINNPTTEDITVDVELYGQTMNENQLFMERSKDSHSSECLEVTNKLLPKSSIENFTAGLLSLVGVRNSGLQLKGLFNPRIKLGNTVFVDVIDSIGVSGYYKVTELNWLIGNTIKCDMKLIKTIV